MARSLRLLSEAYSASGNLAADGYRKLLGAPSINLIQTVIREAVQNSCDAALGDGSAEVHFRLRRLNASQAEALWTQMLPEFPLEDVAAADLKNFRKSAHRWVLEICDFGTKGLAGPTRADLAPAKGEPTDFIDFLRNVGSVRDTHHGGGTYGYGKASLYLASQCSAIVIDSQTTYMGQPVRRVIGAQLGSAFRATDEEGTERRYTGRHWWGVGARDQGFVDPLEGTDAQELAAALGFPDRPAGRAGTSIMILAPYIEEENGEAAIRGIQEALLWFFWPRLLDSTPAARRMRFKTFLEGEEVPLPRPEDFPPLDLFARAMNGLRTDPDAGERIACQKPIKELGRLNIVNGLRGERINYAGEEGSLFPTRCAAIAVMRPVELVVRYYDGDQLPDERMEWAGVFIASDDDEVEAAFAKAEPPAHDDWQPDFLPDRRAQTLVRVGVREIRRHAKEHAFPIRTSISGNAAGPSLAAVSGLMGRMLFGGDGEGAGPRTPGRGGGGGGKKAFKVSAPRFVRLQQGVRGPVAVFEAMITSDGVRSNVLRLEPALAVDGGSVVDADLAPAPEILSVVHDDELLGSGNAVDLGTRTGRIEISLAMPKDYAVTLAARMAEGASA